MTLQNQQRSIYPSNKLLRSLANKRP